MQQRLPLELLELLELLEEQRNFCLHNFGCALGQILDSDPGTEKRKKGLRSMARTLEALNEIDFLIEKYNRAT